MTQIMQQSRKPTSTWQAKCAAAPAAIALIAGGLLALMLVAQPGHNADWYSPRAEEAMETGDYQTAATCYARLLQEHPTDARAAVGLEASLRGLGQAGEADSVRVRFTQRLEATPPAAGGR